MKRRLILLSLACLSATASAQSASPTPETLNRDCTQARAVEPDWTKPDDVRTKAIAAIEACKRATEASPADVAVRKQFAAALLSDGRLALAAEQLRPLAAKDDAEALFTLFEIHNFRERGSDTLVVSRAEAEAALRKAAAGGHAEAMYYLALYSHLGGPLKRDAAAALAWAEKAAAVPKAEVLPRELLGTLLARPERTPAERERGVALLEALVAEGHESRVALALALRGDSARRDPVRARTLLEGAMRERSYSAPAHFADMLIAGEGGPRDVPRALATLRDERFRSSRETQAALGLLHLEGRLVRREPRTALGLMENRSRDDFDTRMRVAELLATHTSVLLRNPKAFLYHMAEAAEVGEPGAMIALMELKLSRHDQLRDETGGYNLAEKIAATDDRALVRVLERRASWVQADAARREIWERELRGGLDRLLAKNFAPAFTLQGKLLRTGGVLPQDDVAATKALQRAAELGDVQGMVLLAKAYDDGLGTPKNPREQLRWLREAAARGSVDARRGLIWEARFDSAKQMTLRDSVTEQVALYNDRLGSVSTMDFIGFTAHSRMSDFQPKRIAEALMDGFRVAPAGLAEDRLVPLMRQIPQNLRAEIETILKAQGHYTGDTQGYFGPEARAALGAWVDAGLGKEPASAESKPATAPARTAALTKEPGTPSVADIPKVSPEALQLYWDRILTAFKSAKDDKQRREAFRMLILLARAGNPHARHQLVKVWDDQALVRELVPAAEVTLWGIDVLLWKLPGQEKAKIEFVFNTGRIDRSRQMERWTDGFITAVRDDPRLSQEGELTKLLGDMVFVGGACEAIAARIRALKLAAVSENDGCGPVARDALLDLIKTQGTTNTEIKARVTAGRQIIAETSGGQAASDKPSEPAAPAKRR